MIYEKLLTTPANTLVHTPVETVIPVHAGHITLVQVEFPKGCAGLVYVQLHYQGTQLYPSNIGDWFTGDGAVLTFAETFPLRKEPHEIICKSFNLDDTYQHSPRVRLQVQEFGGTILEQVFKRLFTLGG